MCVCVGGVGWGGVNRGLMASISKKQFVHSLSLRLQLLLHLPSKSNQPIKCHTRFTKYRTNLVSWRMN